MRIPAILVFGATASGKTDFAVSVFGSDAKSGLAGTCELINADSVQVYKESIIASARPNQQARSAVVHHLVGVRNGNEEFSASDFVHEADRLCREIFQRAKVPVLIGGSAFFLKNFLYNLPATPQADPVIRKNLQADLKQFGEKVMYERLKTCDPVSARRLNEKDHYRVLRALEVYEQQKIPLSSYQLPTEFRNEYHFLILTLTRPREILYRRIDARVEAMFEAGLVEEFLSLYEKGYRKESPIMKAIGYSEFFQFSTEQFSQLSESNRDELKRLIQRDTRRYAKRQETFFKKISCNTVVNLEKPEEVQAAIQKMKCFIDKTSFPH